MALSALEQDLALFGVMLEPMIGFIVFCLKAVAVVTTLFGAWSAVKPGQSIALYQTIMRCFNWRVEPIDRPRELLTTRWLGAALAGCSLVSLVLLW
jgi:hypothetical protein